MEIDDEGEEADPEESEVFCRVAASKGAKVVRLVIPDRCLPRGPGKLVVGSDLVDKRGENPLIALDEMSVGAQVDLQPGR